MKLLSLFTVIWISAFMLICKPALSDDMDNYLISADDEISVTVFNEPDLSINKVRVSGNGAISMPLLGQVNIEGLTLQEVEQQLTNLFLDGYLKKPNVTVTITEYRPFYISGEVKKPGSYPFRKDLTVEKAVVLAGGFTERASRSKISLISEEDKSVAKTVALNDKIRPGDVITVSESFF